MGPLRDWLPAEGLQAHRPLDRLNLGLSGSRPPVDDPLDNPIAGHGFHPARLRDAVANSFHQGPAGLLVRCEGHRHNEAERTA